MSQRVPSCDTSAELDQSASYNCFPTPTFCNNTMFCGTKSRAREQESRNELADHYLPSVPEYDQVAELTWKDGHLAMQDLGSRAPHRHKYNCFSSSSAWSNDPDQPGMVLTRRSQTRSDKEVEGTLDAIVARSLDATMQNLYPIDEDMAFWFQETSLTELQEHPAQKTEKNPDEMVSTASERPEYVLAQSQSSKDDNNSNRNSGSMNFPYFSKPAVRMKAQLQTLGSTSGPTNIQRVRQYSGETEVAVSNPIPASIVGSSGGFCATNSEVSTHANTLASQNCPPPPPTQFARKSSKPMSSTPAAANTTTTTTAYTHTITSDYDMVPKVVEDQSGTSATVGKEKTTSDLNYDAMEVTLVSTSGGSPDNNSMTERSRKEPRWKRKSREQDSACRSEDQDDNQSAQAKKSQTGRRSNSSKRSRAAAVHNQSERRRRDRINERMKALQKLIPNSSKTDKASMLDEAIEYLKHLQAQLQMMCLRNRMNIPPMMLPLGMQQLQMSLLAPLGPMGIGMGMAGMGLGMGVGMIDMNPVAATGRAALVPMGQPLPGTGSHALPVTVHPANFIQPNFTAAAAAGFPAPLPAAVHAPDANDHLKNSAVVDPYSAFMACQRQSMNMNMDLYNSMALLQQQQQLHQQQQQLLHQQQQQQLQPPAATQRPHQQQQQQHQINNSKGA